MINFYEFEMILNEEKKKLHVGYKNKSTIPIRRFEPKRKLLHWDRFPMGSDEYENAKKKSERILFAKKSLRTGKSIEEIRKEKEKELNLKNKLAKQRKNLK